MGLSQDQVASILGCRSGAKISRYERFSRELTLRTAIARRNRDVPTEKKGRS
jgi:transcriptional regulator with XRE-family HTH domain